MCTVYSIYRMSIGHVVVVVKYTEINTIQEYLFFFTVNLTILLHHYCKINPIKAIQDTLS